MGLLNLLGVFVAVVSVSALAADPPVPRGNVSATLNPTTGYYSSTNSTVRLPSGVSISPSTTTVPVVSKYQGGLQQTIPTGITIDAIKKSAPLPAVVRSTTQSVKGAATRCLTSARCNVAGILLAEGLNRLFDGLDWVMGEGGQVRKKEFESSYVDGDFGWVGRGGVVYPVPQAACKSINSNLLPAFFSEGDRAACTPDGTLESGVGGTIFRVGDGCSVGAYDPDKHACGITSDVPVSDTDIAESVDSNYIPEPSDWTALAPELKLDDVEITSAPTLSANPKTTTIYDADGNPIEVQETNTWFDFEPRDNPSEQPALDMKTSEETKTYKDGVLDGIKLNTSKASGGGGGGGAKVDIDVPTDCEFMPTVCAFLDWFKDDDPQEEPDLTALIDDRDFSESYNISGGSKQCPPDYEFTVALVGRAYGLSFGPACDFASTMYYFVMAAAYIFAAYITVGAARHG